MAKDYGIPLEKNISSVSRRCFYQEEFWNFHDQDYLVGLDAHSVTEMTKRYHYAAFFD